jgi:Asp/Glu/hydantoin racemase
MLETNFPRLLGDIGNPATLRQLGIPVRHLTVAGASPERAVLLADPALLPLFVEAAQELVRDGASMISTSCGFLARHQQQLSNALPVPVITSSLLQCSDLPRPGILTIAAAALDEATLAGAGVRPGTPMLGVEPGCEFQRCILGNESQLDAARAESDVVRAAQKLVESHPSVQQIVLECTNMPPYRDAIARATGRTVHDIVTLLVQRWTVLQ